MLNCQQVTKIISSDDSNAMGWRKKVLVRAHLLYCIHCRRFVAQLKLIRKAYRSLFFNQIDRQQDEKIKSIEEKIIASLK